MKSIINFFIYKGIEPNFLEQFWVAIKGIHKPLVFAILFIVGANETRADDLKMGEWAVQGDGVPPAIIGQSTNDHLFVRNAYNDMGTTLSYDNVVSFKSGASQTVWIWLDDDEIYLNDNVQALTPTAYNDNGDLYNEITYNSFQCDIYLPEGISILLNDYSEILYIEGDRMPYTAYLQGAQTQYVSTFRGTDFDIFRFSSGDNQEYSDYSIYPFVDKSSALKNVELTPSREPLIIDGITYNRYIILLCNNTANGTHLSSRDASHYQQYGALKKDDAPVFGITLYNSNQGITQGRLADMIIANQEFGVRECVRDGWAPNDYRFFYGTGGDYVEQRFQYYHRVSLYGSAGIERILATSISLNQTSAEMQKGETMQLIATLLPYNTTFKNVIWGTSDSSIATVNNNGIVTAKTPGTVYITAMTEDGSNLSATCSITVVPPISFVDETVKSICVQNWDTNGDGELSKLEAAAVTSLNNEFYNVKTITSFDELEYFTGLRTIGSYAFYGCSGLTSITIPKSVTSISNSAFSGCSGLNSIRVNYDNPIYDSRDNCNAIIETANNSLYFGCKNTIIPNSVTSIGNSAFYGCSGLTSVNIPNSVTSISNYAFYNCSGLTSVNIPNSVTTIGNYAFQGCTALSTLYFDADSCADFSSTASYRPFYNLNISTINIGNNVQRIPAYFAYDFTELSKITIPNSVTSIGNAAFYGCSGLTSVNIPNSVTSISSSTFYGCSGLTSITIPNSVTSIGNYAFYNCSGLTSITIPNSVTSIGNYALSYCSRLASIDIPNSITSIGIYVFNNCSGLNNITIPNTVTSIGHFAFSYCRGLKSVIIPNSVTSIGNYTFQGCSGLTSIDIPNSVTSIGNSAFQGCSALSTLNYNAGTCADFSSTATERPFNNLNITTINIGNDVQRIPAYFAYGLSKLSNISVSGSVTSVGNSAFYNCTGLTKVTISDIAAWCNINFGNLTANPLYYAQHLYLNDDEITNLVVPDGVETIGSYAFYNGIFSTVRIAKTVTYVGKQAFNNSPSIETVTCAAETPPSWDDIAMFTTNVYNHSPLYVPLGSERSYMSDQCWGQFSTIVGIDIQDVVLATGISLSQSQMSLQAGGTSQLIATVLPDSTTNKAVTWISSAPDIATVDTTGLVTAIAPGSATITATTTDGSNLSASCVVTVIENQISYDNYLSMGDTTVMHGETIVIPVKMTNEASIISFQTDIFLPEGLELLQEDGEYIIDPSERMTRTHSIMSNEVSNGAIRVLCYSSNYKPFTGNSGDDLFYITVKVADDAEGDYTIQLKNTLLTNTDFVDLAAPDMAANVNVKAYLLGDANNSGTVTVGDVVVTAQYVLELNPQPFVFEAADVNMDNNITVADVSRIAWMVLNPALNAPLRAPALWNNGDLMGAEGITLKPGETCRVSITLDNEMDYSAFQLDLKLPSGLTASNFQLTGRASGHAFDVNTLQNGMVRALCYSPLLTAISGHEGALLTFDVTATGNVSGDITVDGIELVTTSCQSVKLDAFTIGVNNASAVNEPAKGKTVDRVDYFNLAGQQIERPESGVTLVVTTYTDGTRTVSKVFR